METPTDHDASFVVQYMERPPRSEWESAQYYFRRYLTKRPTIFLGRLLALVLVGSMFEGLYLRFGPPAEYADAEVPEGERGVWCAHNESELGKVAITLHRAEVSLMDMVSSPYAKVRIGYSDGRSFLKDSRYTRFWWIIKGFINGPKFFASTTPDTESTRYFCIHNSTSSIDIEMWDYNAALPDQLRGSARMPLGEITKPTNRSGWLGMAKQRLELVPAEEDTDFAGWVEVSTQWFPSNHLDELASDLQTGDIVLFSGDTKYGRFIKSSTDSEWSHVGIVWRVPGSPVNDIRVIESSTNRAQLLDCDSGTIHWGVEKVGLFDKVYCAFYDRVAVRRLHLPGGQEEREQLHYDIDEFYKKQNNVSYEEYTLEMLAAAINANAEFDKSSLFCSEFVTYLFNSVGLFADPRTENPSNILQNEFSSELNDRSPIRGGGNLGLEEYVRTPQKFHEGRCWKYPELCQCGPQNKPYNDHYACLVLPCGSILQLWFGQNTDFGVGLPLEVLFICVVSIWMVCCSCLNLSIIARYRQWNRAFKERLVQLAEFHKTTPGTKKGLGTLPRNESVDSKEGGRRRERGEGSRSTEGGRWGSSRPGTVESSPCRSPTSTRDARTVECSPSSMRWESASMRGEGITPNFAKAMSSASASSTPKPQRTHGQGGGVRSWRDQGGQPAFDAGAARQAAQGEGRETPAGREEQPKTRKLMDAPTDEPTIEARTAMLLAELEKDLEKELDMVVTRMTSPDARQGSPNARQEPRQWEGPLPGGEMRDTDEIQRTNSHATTNPPRTQPNEGLSPRVQNRITRIDSQGRARPMSPPRIDATYSPIPGGKRMSRIDSDGLRPMPLESVRALSPGSSRAPRGDWRGSGNDLQPGVSMEEEDHGWLEPRGASKIEEEPESPKVDLTTFRREPATLRDKPKRSYDGGVGNLNADEEAHSDSIEEEQASVERVQSKQKASWEREKSLGEEASVRRDEEHVRALEDEASRTEAQRFAEEKAGEAREAQNMNDELEEHVPTPVPNKAGLS